MTPEISVVIPVYNRTELLRYVVNSALAQTIPVREVILVDDGSGPHVEQEIRRNLKENSDWADRVRYIRQENQGQAVALNNGIANARGEWIAFGADDDFFLPHKFEWQFRAIHKFNGQCDLCFSDAWFMNNPTVKVTVFEHAGVKYKEAIGKIDDLSQFVENPFQTWVQTCVAKKGTILRAGGFDPALRYAEDRDFIFRMSLATTLCYVNMPLVVIDRRPPEQRHLGHAADWNKESFRLKMDQYSHEKKLRLVQGMEPRIRGIIRKNLREIHSSWANLYLTTGEVSKAVESLSEAAKYGLTPNIALKWGLVRLVPGLMRKAMLTRERLMPGLNFR